MKKIKNMLTLIGGLFLLSCDKPDKLEDKPESWPISATSPDANGNVQKNLVIVFDGSGSMSEDGKIRIAKNAVKTYISSLPKDVMVGVVIFNDGDMRNETAQNNRSTILESIEKIHPSGSTPLTEAVRVAYENLIKIAKTQKSPAEYHLAVVTDGIANDEDSLRVVVDDIVNDSPVRIFTIGFMIGSSHALNQPGKMKYVSADNEKELKKGLGQILAEKEE